MDFLKYFYFILPLIIILGCFLSGVYKVSGYRYLYRSIFLAVFIVYIVISGSYMVSAENIFNIVTIFMASLVSAVNILFVNRRLKKSIDNGVFWVELKNESNAMIMCLLVLSVLIFFIYELRSEWLKLTWMGFIYGVFVGSMYEIIIVLKEERRIGHKLMVKLKP